MSENEANTVSETGTFYSANSTQSSNTSFQSLTTKTRGSPVFFNVLLTNARSLIPKLDSLLEHFRELDLFCAIVTESWLRPGNVLKAELEELDTAEKISVIHKSRKTRKGRTAGGGVALIFDKNKCDFKEIPIAGKYEITAAIGNIPGLKRKVAVVGTYIPPSYKAAQNEGVLEKLGEVLSQIKLKYNNPLIISGGDFNTRQHDYAHSYTPDMIQINTAPTRQNELLDVLYCNFVHDIVELETHEPLISNSGNKSDHACIVAIFDLKDIHMFTKKSITVRPRTKKGEANFAKMIARMATTLDANGRIPLALTECPRNVTVEAPNTHLSLLIASPAASRRRRSCLTWEM